MKNTIIVSVCLFLAVVAASIFYFSGLGNNEKDNSKAFTFLPQETLLIASFQNDETTDNIFKDFEIFDALLGFKNKKNLDNIKQELLRSSALNDYFLNSNILVSFHEFNKQIEPVFTISANKSIDPSDLNQLLNSLDSSYHTQQQDTLGYTLFSFSKNEAQPTIYAVYTSDILFASQSKDLLLQFFDKNIEKISKNQINYFLEKTNRNVPLSIYYPHQQSERITNLLKKGKPGDFIQQFVSLKGQSVWNINYKQDALMLTGESELQEKEKSYISLFANQPKTSQRLYNYFPSNTALYVEYSLSDVSKFRQDLEKYLDKQDDWNKIKKQLSNQKVESIQEYLGSEFSIIELNNRNYIGFISMNDDNSWRKIVQNHAEKSTDSIYRFTESNLLYAAYGDALKPFVKPYFLRVHDIIVIANNVSTLNDFAEDWRQKNLLIGTVGFKNYEKIQGNEANITLFVQTKNALNSFTNLLQPNYLKNFRDKENFGFQDFYSWSAQLSGNAGRFVSSIYGIYKSSTSLGSTPEWTYQFNHRLITRPYVFEHSDTSQFILAQEQDHTIQALTPSGKKIWSTVFSGRVVGEITQLADRSILLATDRNRLYRFDTSGKALKGFSIALPNEPTGTPLVYNLGEKDYIFVPSKNTLLLYDMEGNPHQQWKNINIDGSILDGIHLSKQMIVFGTTFGRLYFFDFKGSKLKEIDIPGDVEFSKSIGQIKRNGEDIFIAVDTKGNMYQLSYSKDIISRKEIGLSENSSIYFQKPSRSESLNMFSIEGNKITSFTITDNTNKKYDYTLTKDIDNSPLFFSDGQNHFVGMSSPSSNLIYLLNEEGSLVNGFPTEGRTFFYYGKINYNSANHLLITKRDHKLYVFKH